ncbi:CWC25 spliceosome associated protein homolog [Anticarsia gemmatalis]|uniref:CWC25 spliceosome associated protein homolog n=1 Tax=Anticarsia gemmatalis TaxID=129554 RepID=UPI003F7641B1
MGGGDLNSKKSWHPNTMKNQERVWKAEQAAAEEKKRMIELQRERAEERDRAELNSIMSSNKAASASDNRLSWMYDKPDKKVEQEAYLLGKALDKNSERAEQAEPDAIPAVSRRVVGSSMLAAGGDAQVDISRKIREDPLLLIKERERAARAALLNNPLQRRRLTELLRKEQDQRKESSKSKPKKKDKDLDDMLAEKLNALRGRKAIDLATLLVSDESSSDSDDDKPKKKKNKRDKEKSKKKKKRKHSSSDDESDSSTQTYEETQHREQKSENKGSDHRRDKYYKNEKDSRKRTSPAGRRRSRSSDRTEHYRKETSDYKRDKYDSSSTSKYYKDVSGKYGSRSYTPPRETNRRADSDHRDSKRRGGLSEEEKAARLAEMAAAGAEREEQRGRRVAEQRAQDAAAARAGPAPRSAARHEARALPDSLESRIHSTRHYIQRDKRHMNENFARR